MAKINLTALPKQQSNSAYLYKDVHLDLIENYTANSQKYKQQERQDFKADYDVEAVKNSIRNLLTTSPGEKILNPAYGLDFRGLLFEQVTKFRGEQLGNIITSQINVFEPRVVIDFIKIAVDEDQQQYEIDISISVPSLNLTGVSILGILNNDGYIFTKV
jgi:phage baseplate assembly protein W